MIKKTNDIQKFIKSVGKTEHLHIFAGNTTVDLNNSSYDSQIQLWRDTIFTKKITRGDVFGVIPNLTWTRGNIYYPWKSSTINTGAFYAWNRENGNVYLCINNNTFARVDLSGVAASTYIPNHSYGIQAYPDGYSWMPIYRITGDMLRFVNNSWIPVISFEDFELSTAATEYENTVNFCNTSISTQGNCALYFKNYTKIPTSSTTFTSFEKGSLYKNLEITCNECYNLFFQDDFFEVVFTTNTPQNKITIKDKFDEITELIADNKISPSSPYYSLHEIAQNGLEDGAIISAQIDLSGFNPDDLRVTESNPELIVTSFTGQNASIKLKTIFTINGQHLINGIEVISNGSGYKDANIDIPDTIFVNDQIKFLLLASITLNYDTLDGLNVDPYDVMNCTNIMVDSRIDTNELILNNVQIPENINFYGLVSNPTEVINSSETIISGSELSPYTSKISNATTIAFVTFEEDVGQGQKKLSPSTGKSEIKEDTDSKSITSEIIEVLPNENYNVANNQSVISINGLEYNDILPNLVIKDSNDLNFIINEIYQKPNFSQYSGKILQTTKLQNNLRLKSASGDLSKILRINIIKGL